MESTQIQGLNKIIKIFSTLTTTGKLLKIGIVLRGGGSAQITLLGAGSHLLRWLWVLAVRRQSSSCSNMVTNPVQQRSVELPGLARLGCFKHFWRLSQV